MPFQSSGCWWKLRRGFCKAHTFQLGIRDGNQTSQRQSLKYWQCWLIFSSCFLKMPQKLMWVTHGDTWAVGRSTWVLPSLGCSKWGGWSRTERSLYCRWTARLSRRWSGCLWSLSGCAPRFLDLGRSELCVILNRKLGFVYSLWHLQLYSLLIRYTHVA